MLPLEVLTPQYPDPRNSIIPEPTTEELLTLPETVTAPLPPLLVELKLTLPARTRLPP